MKVSVRPLYARTKDAHHAFGENASLSLVRQCSRKERSMLHAADLRRISRRFQTVEHTSALSAASSIEAPG